MSAIAFDEASHTYRVGGQRWPGVSEVLDPINELDGIPRDVLAAAAEFGKHVHLACHLFNQGTLDRAALDPRLEPYLAGWELFLLETGARVVASELPVMHPTHHYCGTLDAVIEWRGRRHVLDIKTSASVPRTVGPQTAAYFEAYLCEEFLSAVRYCVHLTGDGKYKLVKLHDPTDLSMFVSCLNIWRWRNRK